MSEAIRSACTVTTAETLSECLVAVFSFQQVHPSVPVYVACQKEQEQAILSVGAVPVVQELLELPNKVRLHNLYHRPDAIRMKMDIMEIAIEKHGNALFFDADIIFCQPVQLPANVGEVMLSLNMSITTNMQETASKFGMFNAGLLWSRSLEFVRWWRDEYLNPKMHNAFYEQGCLSLVPAKWETDYFPLHHNWGFWRGTPKRQVGSYHLHLTDNLFMTDYIRQGTLAMRPEVWQKMPSKVAKFAHKVFGHPQKVWFVHYGKAAGVYTSKAFKRILAGYDVHDSWHEPFNLHRDWTEEELHDILTTKDGFLHQHHGAITEEQLVLAKKHGWKTVMFYRDPRSLICSLYHFGLRRIAETGEVWLFDAPQKDLGTFDQFFSKALKFPALWTLPDWHGLLDYCLPFSAENLDKVFLDWFGTPHPVGPKVNTSNNPGWKQQMTSEHLEALSEIPAFHRSLDFMKS